MRNSLLLKIIAAILLGIGLGYVCPDWLTRGFVTFNGLFSQFLSFIIPLIIVGFVTPAIADVGTKAGRMLLITALLAYAATLLSGLFSYEVSKWAFPHLITRGAVSSTDMAFDALNPYFSVEIAPLFGVMTALVTSFVCGLGMAFCNLNGLKNLASEFRILIERVISGVIIPLLPFYIMGIFMNMTRDGQVGAVLNAFLSIIAIIFAMHVLLLLFQFCVAGAISRRNPLKALRCMLPAYFTALGTQSSAATIPVTLKQCTSLGVRKEIAGFVIPLCANIHMSGSTLKIVACAVALMIMQGIEYDFVQMAGFIAMLGVTIIAAPGVPGGAIMASLGVLSSMLGFSEADNALMISLYIAMDSFGTACNVTGDGALAMIVDRVAEQENK